MRGMGRRVRELRRGKQVRQKDFATLLGVTRMSIWRLENNKLNISVEKCVRIAEYFDVSLDFLILGINKKREEEKKC